MAVSAGVGSRPVSGNVSHSPVPCCSIVRSCLDEATSQLDDPIARSINQQLLGERHQGTVIVIAHRVSTIIDLPRILVLDGGKINADGNHAELLRTSGKYRTLFASEPG